MMDRRDEIHRLRRRLDEAEERRLASFATPSRAGVRRRAEDLPGEYRQAFAQDADRILHSRSYTRYIDKTQVFYLVENDHITHRVLHVQLVSKIARTIGRFLGLNEDLIEAIALGHDIGHPPFGHEGERVLHQLCREHGLPGFLHNVQSVRFLEEIERRGRGWNLTLQTLDGILCHDGEVHDARLAPDRAKDFSVFDREKEAKLAEPGLPLRPMTLEGCLVRFADTVSYIGRDIEDAIELGLIRRSDLPPECVRLLGDTNGTIVYRLVSDLIVNGIEDDAIAFSPEISEGLRRLKAFNYERIYLNPAIKRDLDRIEACYRALFAAFLDAVRCGRRNSLIFRDFLDNMDDCYREQTPATAIVRDFIAGMTDEYFLRAAAGLGCALPRKAA